ncbi:sensor histidine kinase [Brevibacterium sp. FAM 25378]|uniref:sensor histidine kinase n=1 Tax=unclassified Brevibacterium TaxID=2614124 RepID=UPI00143CE5D1|nr:HAMP domain-containing sensor histidine kinase [Brevibacterium sp. S22]
MVRQFRLAIRPVRWLQRWSHNHLTARWRLTLTYGLLAALVAAGAVIAINLVMRIPSYTFARTLSPTTPNPTEKHSPSDPARTVAVTPGNKLTTITNTSSLFDTLWLVSISIGIVLVVITTITAWIVAGRVLRPLKHLNNAARVTAAGSLTHRLDTSGARDEITTLAATFNEMLGRLDRQIESHRRFAANASHELRTPLATTKAMLQVAADSELQEPQTHQLIDRLMITNQRSIDLVDALLTLSDSENVALDSRPLNLETIATDVLLEAELTTHYQRVELDHDFRQARCHADPGLVRLIITNLLSNAIRHNVADGRALIKTESTAGWSSVIISNTGNELDQEQIDHLLGPFSRRRVGSEGHGLGLAITDNLVKANRGRLELSARSGGGLIARAEFPAIP